ncbi:hypothetical protein ID866_2068 [Astraeus odoratus]|nr:hypothetical protein ID866_2068 [Astraeus odoratus]
MSSQVPFDLPTLSDLGVESTVLDGLSLSEAAKSWLTAFSTSLGNKDVQAVVSSFHEYGFWKDILALTWNLRTIRGSGAIRALLDDRLASTGLTALHLAEDALRAPTLVEPMPGAVFLRICFEFETCHGKGSAIAFLVPTPGTAWKAWSLFTRLESLKDHPENVGNLRDHTMHHDWEERRLRESSLADGDPAVLVIGAGHTGLEIAARLKYLGVSTLVIDRQARVGDSWRTRYKSLSLHDIVSYNQMPYLQFPSTWPLYCPAPKLADWLEFYANALDLNVWLSCKVSDAKWNEDVKTWTISIDRNGDMRTMSIRHLVFATGFGGGFPKTPDIEGKETYNGSILHSTEYKSAATYSGKKAVVVGASNSAHDIAMDLYCHDVDVTMIQRSSTHITSLAAITAALKETYNERFPVDLADTLGSALPWPTALTLLKGRTAHVANHIDKDLIDGLEKAGFRTNLGIDGGGFLPLVYARGGGFYIDTGASQEIIDGNIKIKSGRSVRTFTSHGLELEDGTELECDVVIFATGYGELRDSMREICGPDVANRVGPIWGLDSEGELQGVWRKTGQPRLWIGMGNFGRTRFHSLHLALQIKALEEGLITDDDIYVQ